MSKKKLQAFDFAQTKQELTDLLSNFAVLVESTTSDVREKVLALIPAFHLLRQIGINILPDAPGAARDRILLYLKKYPEKIIDSEELLVISGITDYQRRIRELRSQMGWPILSGNTIQLLEKEGEWDLDMEGVKNIKPDQYVFLNSGQDKEAAYRWTISNEIRRKKIGVKEKLLEYFRGNVGKIITGEELLYLAKDTKEWARRIRELRTEEGWPIKTKSSGRPDLSVGTYILEEDKQAEQHDRKIDDSIRVEVLERDHYSCRKCGWSLAKRQDGDPRNLLELHHLDYHADKGSNTFDNLITICNVHHDYIHKHHMNKNEVQQWVNTTI